jgi:transposase-like protein
VKQPRVRDKREGKSFTSAILPRYMRRVPSLNNLIPILYLKGISTGDFTEALEAILGENAKGLSASTVVRLKKQWEQGFREWAGRDLAGLRYVYFWADGIHFNVRLEDTENKRRCILVIIGAREDGTKELVAVLDGYRESKLSWMVELLIISQGTGTVRHPEQDAEERPAEGKGEDLRHLPRSHQGAGPRRTLYAKKFPEACECLTKEKPFLIGM